MFHSDMDFMCIFHFCKNDEKCNFGRESKYQIPLHIHIKSKVSDSLSLSPGPVVLRDGVR